MEAAKKGIVTPEMETVAKKENMDVNELMALVAAGQVAIPANVNHTALSAEGIGKGLKTKINVNLGISGDALRIMTLRCRKWIWLSSLAQKLSWICQTTARPILSEKS